MFRTQVFGTQVQDREYFKELLECYNVSTGHRVWNWSRKGFGVLDPQFDVCRGSKVTMSLILWPWQFGLYVVPFSFCGSILNHTCSGMSFEVLLLEADFESGHSREIIHFFERGFKFQGPQIADDYWGCTALVNDMEWIPLLVNHRTKQYIAIECSTLV
jgi:hypothetical protein